MQPTAGILYCGDLGAAFARLLRRSGLRVVTTCQDRSPATERRAAAAEIEILPTFDDVVRQSELVFSFVLPTAAVEVAGRYSERSHLRPPSAVFVDVNSLGEPTLHEIASLLHRQNVPLVDASIHGVAAKLQELGVIYVSGPHADRVAAVCEGLMRVRSLGDRVGTAKRMKLLIAGLSKCLNVLFLEVGVLAQNAGMLDEFLESCRHFYPGILTPIERMLPTYPQHAARRVGELRSIEELARSCRSPHGMIHAAGELLEGLVNRGLTPVGSPDVTEVIRLFATTLSRGDP